MVQQKPAYQESYPRLLTNRTGTFATPRVITIFASSTLSIQASLVSPSFSIGSIRQSRRRSVRKHTASVVANFLPMHARAPNDCKSYLCGGVDKGVNTPTLNAENTSDSFETPYHREGLYFSGSSKYLGLYSEKQEIMYRST